MLKFLAAVAALLPVVAFGQATLITGTPIPVNTSPGVQTDAHVSGNYVAYTNEAGGNRINYFDLSSRINREVPNPNSDYDFLSDISGTNVVFTRVNADRTAILSFDIATGAEPVEIAPQQGSNRRDPAVGGRTVAWQDFGVSGAIPGSSEIMVHDLVSGITKQLTSDGLLDRTVAVSPDGNMVAWAKCAITGRDCAIWRAVRSPDGLWSSTAITGTGTGAVGDEAFPDTNGSLVTYDSIRTIGGIPEKDIYWQPGPAGVERRLDLAGVQKNPHVSSTVIAFEHFDSTAAIPNWDILLFDTATSTLYQLIRSDAYETLIDIYVSGNIGKVVYQVADDVYAVSFELPAAPPPPPPPPDGVVFPATAATVQFFPEFAIGPRNAPVQNSVQSSYFRSTNQNREFRRGFAEFALPSVPDLFAARLRFDECRGISGFPLPPDSHELSYYAWADLVINAADYRRATTPLTTFDTDGNLNPASFSYDVTDLFRQHQGTSLGLRFKLTADPTLATMGFAGSEFCNIRIQTVTLTKAPLQLAAEITQFGLPNGIETSLIAKLNAAYAALASGNAAAACASLGALINQVNAQSGSIPADSAAHIIGVATALREALNCR